MASDVHTLQVREFKTDMMVELAQRGALAPTREFVDKLLLPIEELGGKAKIRRKLDSKNLYDFDKKEWRDIPKDPHNEAALYEPFVKVANAVVRFSKRLYQGDRRMKGLHWMARPDNTPRSLDPLAPRIRPDIVNMITMNSLEREALDGVLSGWETDMEEERIREENEKSGQPQAKKDENVREQLSVGSNTGY